MDGNFLQGGMVHGVRRIRSTTRVHHQGLPFTTVTAMTEQLDVDLENLRQKSYYTEYVISIHADGIFRH
ncbi:unnamed protein product [Brassica oleracea var. botrytis]